jgi:hypothetical protein
VGVNGPDIFDLFIFGLFIFGFTGQHSLPAAQAMACHQVGSRVNNEFDRVWKEDIAGS